MIGFGGALLCAATSCEPDAQIKEYVYPAPTVSSVSPEKGYVLSHMIIEGNNFGEEAKAIKVGFGGVWTDSILSCTNNRIIVVIPKEANAGRVGLKCWTHQLDSISDFTPMPTPEFDSAKSDNQLGDIFAKAGDVITLTGTGFGTDIKAVTAKIGDDVANIKSLKDNAILIEVPQTFQDAGKLYVEINKYPYEGPTFVNPDKKGDVTDIFLPNHSAPFQTTVPRGDSEWAIAKNWMFEGGFDNGGSLWFTNDYPDGVIRLNGNNNYDASMYQVTTLPKGTYTFTINVAEDNKSSGRYAAFFAVMNDDIDFPTIKDKPSKDFTDNTNVLGKVMLSNQTGKTPQTYTFEVTLSDTKKVRLGFATWLAKGNTILVKDVKIERK